MVSFQTFKVFLMDKNLLLSCISRSWKTGIMLLPEKQHSRKLPLTKQHISGKKLSLVNCLLSGSDRGISCNFNFNFSHTDMIADNHL